MFDYFWPVIIVGSARLRCSDGRIAEVSYASGDTQHHRFGPGKFMIHNLENTGETELIFTRVEFLDRRELAIADLCLEPVAAGCALVCGQMMQRLRTDLEAEGASGTL